MTDIRQETVDTYNRSAKAFAEKFQGIGSRLKDIDLVFSLMAEPNNAHVVEIGCGDGRDAKEIIKRTPNYLGFDASEEMIKLARKHVPEAEFVVADANKFVFSKNLDAVFAFASLLHLSRDEVKSIFRKVYTALKPGGIFYISVKYAPKYTKLIKKDEFGKRLFYLYNSKTMRGLAGEGYRVVVDYNKTLRNIEWLEIAFKKT